MSLFLKGRFGALLAITLGLIFVTIDVFAQTDKREVAAYGIGDTMLNLIIEQNAWQGASPAELEGMRIGFQAKLAEVVMEIVLYNDNTLTFQMGKNQGIFNFIVHGLRLYVIKPGMEQEIEFGIFSQDRSTLTINKSSILDKVR